jgi:hypothetical protein
MTTLAKIIENIALVDSKIDELYSFTDYPYKKGHVICVNKSLDIWECSKKNARMISTQNSKHTRLIEQLKHECIKTDFPRYTVLTLLVANGMQIDIAEEYVKEWIGE